MRLYLAYLLQNVARNPLRAWLTGAAVALPIMILVLSGAVIDGIERYLDNAGRQLRLIVTQKTSIVNPLPEGHRAKILALDPQRERLVSVCGAAWIGGSVNNDPRPLSTLAVDHDTFLETMPEHRLAPDEAELWQRERRAIVVGVATARQFQWSKGDTITVQASVPPYEPLEFIVVSTIPDSPDQVTLWCRRDYVDERVVANGFEAGQVSFFYVKCRSRTALDEFRTMIDAAFARTPDETESVDEKAFMARMIGQQFDLPRNLRILAAVTVFVAVMAAANTMSMNFRDRLREYATLKALGFSGGYVFSLVQFESMFLCALGGVIGAAAPYVAFTHTPLAAIRIPIVEQLEIRMELCAIALLVALGIGLVSAVWPSWLALRLRVVAALRHLG